MNPLAAMVGQVMLSLLQQLDEAHLRFPAEVSLRGYLPKLKLDVTFGAAVWNGERLTDVVAYRNSTLLADSKPPANKRFYTYLLLRSPLKPVGIKHLYVLPPGEALEVDVNDDDSRDALLEAEVEVTYIAETVLRST